MLSLAGRRVFLPAFIFLKEQIMQKRKVSFPIAELKAAFTEWNENSDQFPSNRLLTAINCVISRNPSEKELLKMSIRKHGKVCGNCREWKTCSHTESWRVNQDCSREAGVNWVSPFSKATK